MEREDITKRISSNSALIYALIVLLGLVKISSYYRFFSINILNYLSISEVILVFFDNIVEYIFIFIFIAIPGFISQYSKVGTSSKDPWLNLPLPDKKEELFEIIGALIFTLIFFMLNLYYLSLLSGIIFAIFLAQLLLKRIKEFDNVFILPFMIFCFLFIFNWFYGKQEAYEALYKNEHRIATFSYKGVNVQSNDTLLYIGELSDYIFLYDKNDKMSHVYPKSELSNLSFQSRNEIDSLLFKNKFKFLWERFSSTYSDNYDMNSIYNKSPKYLIKLKSATPIWLQKIIKWGMIFIGIMAIMFIIYIPYWAIIEPVKYFRWKKSNKSNWLKFLASLEFDDATISKYVKKPYSLPQEIIKKYEGPKMPDYHGLLAIPFKVLLLIVFALICLYCFLFGLYGL